MIQVLYPHFKKRNIHVKAIDLGGGLSWEKLQNQLNDALKQKRQHEWATTMVDLYRLMNLPGISPGSNLRGTEKALAIESEMANLCPNPNFIPYVQVHEFESLLFVDLQKLENNIPGETKKAIRELRQQTLNLKPEDINEGTNTAPSKRILNAIPHYETLKISTGPVVAKEIGLSAIRSACPHFNDWISKLEQL